MQLSEIDVVSNDVYERGVPYEQLAYLRREAPVFKQSVPDPALIDEVWVISRYEDIVAVSKDPKTFSSGLNGPQLRPQRPAEVPGSFISADDPEHSRLRSLVSKAFTPRVVKNFEHHYRDLAIRLVEAALENERFDLVAEISQGLPMLAICELLGVPEEDRDKIMHWSNAIIASEDPEYAGSKDDILEAFQGAMGYVRSLGQRRREEPGEDLISKLVSRDGESGLTDAELGGFVVLLFVAGNETTRNNISHGMMALMDHPEQLQRLQQDPSRHLESAVEEITRWASPVIHMARTATRDVELRGQHIRAGERVAMFYPSANRDEDIFADPDSFDIAREPNRHLAFGIGPHFCLGANLARIETRLILEEFLPRIRSIELDGEVERVRSSFVNGVKRLPVRVQAA